MKTHLLGWFFFLVGLLKYQVENMPRKEFFFNTAAQKK